MLKLGELIVCVSGDYKKDITQHKVYKALSNETTYMNGITTVSIENDRGFSGSYFSSRFTSLSSMIDEND